MKLRATVVTALILVTSSAATRAQSWKDIVNKAKQRVQEQIPKPKSTNTENNQSTAPNSSPMPSPSTSEDSRTAAPHSMGSVPGGQRYTWCRIAEAGSGARRIFTSENIPTSYVNSSQFRPIREAKYMDPFRAYVESKYNLRELNLGSVSCVDPTLSTQELENYIHDPHGAWVVVQTGWTGPSPNSSTTAENESSPATSTGYSVASSRTSADNSQYETHGPQGYTWCFTTLDRTKYISDTFPANGPDPGTTTSQFRGKFYQHYAIPFKNFVDVKYNASLNRQTSYGCQDPVSTFQAAEAQRVRNQSHDDQIVMQTGWKGSNAIDAAVAQNLEPTNRQQLNLDRAIEREQQSLPQWCKNNALMSGNLYCDCFADHLHQARLHEKNTVATESSPIHPLVGDLLPKAHLEACTSRDRIEAYAAKQIDSMAMPQNKKDIFKQCAPPRVATLVLQQPLALSDIRIYNNLMTQALGACSSPR